jgi:hypothetical protein
MEKPVNKNLIRIELLSFFECLTCNLINLWKLLSKNMRIQSNYILIIDKKKILNKG